MTTISQYITDSKYPVVVAAIILVIATTWAYSTYILDTPSMSKATIQLLKWMMAPQIAGSFSSHYAVTLGLLLLDLLTGLSLITIILPLDFQKNYVFVFSCAMLLGLGLIGISSILSVEFHNFTRESVLSLTAIIIISSNYINYRHNHQTIGQFLLEFVRDIRYTISTQTLAIRHFYLRLFVPAAVLIMYILIFFQATSFPITEWDSIVYHANVARLWYEYAPNYRIIAGPSVGIEMSYPFPPLFPAIGAAHYIIAGEFNDLYLKIEAPLLSLITASLVYFIAKKHLSTIPGLAVIALLSMPFFVMYSIWPTNYSTLMALTTASILFLTMTLETRSWRYSLLAGLFAAFAALSSYYGIILVIFGGIVLGCYLVRKMITRYQLIDTQSYTHLYSSIHLLLPPESKRIIVPFLIVGISVGSIWYVFNLITLGDPFFPLGYKFFHSSFVDQDVLSKSLEQVKRNALGYWGDATGVELVKRQLYSILFDPHLYSLSLLPGMIGLTLAVWRRNSAMIIFGTWMLLIIFSQLLQGWFWLRTLTMILPSVAVLSAYAIHVVLLLMETRKWSLSRRAFKYIVISLFFSAMIYPGFVIGMIGINHPTIVYGIPEQMKYDYLYSWKNIGNDQAILQGTFMGEADAWDWMNKNIPAGSKIATLDAREYYVRPDMFFYLDGKEATPLLHMKDPIAIRQFLVENHVRYIWMPGSTFRTAAAYPIINDLPLFQYLGTSEFPISKMYDAWVPPSLLYDIYPSNGTSQDVTTFLTGTTVTGDYNIVEANNVRGGLFFINTSEPGTYEIRITYRDSGHGNVDFNLEENNKWQIGYSNLQRDNTNDTMIHTFSISPKTKTLTTLGIYSYADDFYIKRIDVVKIDGKTPSISFSGASLGGKDLSWAVFRAMGVKDRIFITTPEAKKYVATITYEDYGRGNVDFNLQNDDGSWRTGYSILHRNDSGGNRIHSFYVDGRPNSIVPIGVFVHDEKLVIHQITISPVTGSEPEIALSGVNLQNSTFKVLGNDINSKILVVAPILGEKYDVQFRYKDIGHGKVDLNLQNENGTWIDGYSTIIRNNSNSTRLHVLHIDGRSASPIIIGMHSSDDLTISDLRITDHNKNSNSLTLSGVSVEGSYYIVRAGDPAARLFVSGSNSGKYEITIGYKDRGSSNVDFNLQNRNGTWSGLSSITLSDSGTSKFHNLYLNGSSNFSTVLGIYAQSSDFYINDLNITKVTDISIPETSYNTPKNNVKDDNSTVEKQSSIDNGTTPQGKILIKKGSVNNELSLKTPEDGLYRITISYDDIGKDQVDLNLQNENGTWIDGYSTIIRNNSNSTKLHSFYAEGKKNSTITFGIYVRESDLKIESVNLGKISEYPLLGHGEAGQYKINVRYLDVNSTSLELAIKDDHGKILNVLKIPRTNSNLTRTYLSYISLPANTTTFVGVYPDDRSVSVAVDKVNVNMSQSTIDLSNAIRENNTWVIPTADNNPRLLLRTPDDDFYRVTVKYADINSNSVDFNLQNQNETWSNAYSTIVTDGTHQNKIHTFVLEGRKNATIAMGIYAHADDFRIEQLDVSRIDKTQPSIVLSEQIAENNGEYLVKAGDDKIRLYAHTPNSGSYLVTVTYNDAGIGNVDLNLQNSNGTWQGSYSTINLMNTNATKIHTFFLNAPANSDLTMGIHGYETDLHIQSLEISYLDLTTRSAYLSGVSLNNDHFVVPKGYPFSRIYATLPDDEGNRILLQVAYNTSGQVDFNVQNGDGTWKTVPTQMFIDGRTHEKFLAFLLQGKGNSLKTIGIFPYEEDLEILKISINKQYDLIHLFSDKY